MSCNCTLSVRFPVIEDVMAATAKAAEQAAMAVALGLLDPEIGLLIAQGDLAVSKQRFGQAQARFRGLLKACEELTAARNAEFTKKHPAKDNVPAGQFDGKPIGEQPDLESWPAAGKPANVLTNV